MSLTTGLLLPTQKMHAVDNRTAVANRVHAIDNRFSAAIESILAIGNRTTTTTTTNRVIVHY